jgi:hypothetical protein
MELREKVNELTEMCNAFLRDLSVAAPHGHRSITMCINDIPANELREYVDANPKPHAPDEKEEQLTDNGIWYFQHWPTGNHDIIIHLYSEPTTQIG